jgi:hypothetical protein
LPKRKLLKQRRYTYFFNGTLECDFVSEDVVGVKSACGRGVVPGTLGQVTQSFRQSRVSRSRPIALIDNDKTIALAAVIFGLASKERWARSTR